MAVVRLDDAGSRALVCDEERLAGLSSSHDRQVTDDEEWAPHGYDGSKAGKGMVGKVAERRDRLGLRQAMPSVTSRAQRAAERDATRRKDKSVDWLCDSSDSGRDAKRV